MITKLYLTWTEQLPTFLPACKKLRYINGDTIKYCPLGATCELSQLGKWNGSYYIINNIDIKTSILPLAVTQALNFKTPDGAYNPQDLSEELRQSINSFLEKSWKSLHNKNTHKIPTIEELYSITRLNDLMLLTPTTNTSKQELRKLLNLSSNLKIDNISNFVFLVIQKVLQEKPKSLFKNYTNPSKLSNEGLLST